MAKRARKSAKPAKTAKRETTKKSPYEFPEPIVGISTVNGVLLIATARSIYQKLGASFVRLRLVDENHPMVDAG